MTFTNDDFINQLSNKELREYERLWNRVFGQRKGNAIIERNDFFNRDYLNLCEEKQERDLYSMQYKAIYEEIFDEKRKKKETQRENEGQIRKEVEEEMKSITEGRKKRKYLSLMNENYEMNLNIFAERMEENIQEKIIGQYCSKKQQMEHHFNEERQEEDIKRYRRNEGQKIVYGVEEGYKRCEWKEDYFYDARFLYYNKQATRKVPTLRFFEQFKYYGMRCTQHGCQFTVNHILNHSEKVKEKMKEIYQYVFTTKAEDSSFNMKKFTQIRWMCNWCMKKIRDIVKANVRMTDLILLEQ